MTINAPVEALAALEQMNPPDSYPCITQAEFDALPVRCGFRQCPAGYDYDSVDFGHGGSKIETPCVSGQIMRLVGVIIKRPDGEAR